MKIKFEKYLLTAIICVVAVGVFACGEKNRFDVSMMEKEFSNVKLASVGGTFDIILNEERTQKFMDLFEGLVFEQTQSAGSLSEKSYSIIFLNGKVAVDSIQISGDGQTITYGGYFYQLEEGTYNSAEMLHLFEEQQEEDAPEETESVTSKQEETAPDSNDGETTYIDEKQKEKEKDLIYRENQTQTQWIELTQEDFTDKKIIAVPGGSACQADLDGDGTAEEILYEVQWAGDGGEPELLFAIGGVGCSNKFRGEWAYLVTPSNETYFVTDLDSTDKYLEIAVLDNGPSADPEFHFIRYKNGELFYLGSVFTDTVYSNLTLKGDGKIIGSGRLSLLQTWAAPFTWYTNGDSIQLLEEEWYYPYVNSNAEQKVKQLKPITVYAEADLEAEKTQVEAADAVVTFGMTDNKNWVQFFRGDGVTGWIYLKDGFYLEGDGEEIMVTEAFENLSMAG